MAVNKTQLLNWVQKNIKAGDTLKIQIGRFTKNDNEPRIIKKKMVIDYE